MSAPAADRRTLRFRALSDVIDEADRLAAAEAAGMLQRHGQWTLGQAVNHIGAWTEFAFSPPPLPKPPLLMRLFPRVAKRHVLKRGLSPGFNFGGVPGGTLATEVVPNDAARERLRRAFDRLNREAPTRPNEMFGPLTHDEWKQLQLRHAELHLGFFGP